MGSTAGFEYKTHLHTLLAQRLQSLLVLGGETVQARHINFVDGNDERLWG